MGGCPPEVFDSSDNALGGAAEGEGNVIAFNAGDGVEIRSVSSTLAETGNRVQFNSIFSNAGLGIDLVGGAENSNGATKNDTTDPDAGPNLLQNKPVVTSATTISSGGTTTIKGKLNSTPDTRFLVELFSNPSGEDEGKKPLGLKLVTTNANGNVSFTFTPSRTVSAGRNVTATATDRGLNTSEFSVPYTVVAS